MISKQGTVDESVLCHNRQFQKEKLSERELFAQQHNRNCNRISSLSTSLLLTFVIARFYHPCDANYDWFYSYD